MSRLLPAGTWELLRFADRTNKQLCCVRVIFRSRSAGFVSCSSHIEVLTLSLFQDGPLGPSCWKQSWRWHRMFKQWQVELS